MAKPLTWRDVEDAAEALRTYKRITGERPPEKMLWTYRLAKLVVSGASQAVIDKSLEEFDARFPSPS